MAHFDERLLTETPGATIAIKLDGTVVYWNRGAEMLFGYPNLEAIGLSFYDLVIPVDHQESERSALLQVENSGSFTFASLRRRKDGALINVLVSSKLIRGESGEAEYVVSNKTDV